jgi:preprotein translocase subunit YajC
MIEAVKKGDKIVTIGGVHGTVHAVKEGTVVVKVDDDCKIEFSKSAVATVSVARVEEKPAEAVPEKAEEEKK